MSQHTFQLAANAAGVYEEQKVPAMFGPLADATLDLVPLEPDDAILDVACGTGIMARKIRERIGPSARIAGVDVNEGMISIARNLSDDNARSCEWHISAVEDMPFEEGTFSKAFCQQGFQFFPDEKAALVEMRRIMRPGGLIVLTLWSKPSQLFVVIADALGRYVSHEAGEILRHPIDYAQRKALTDRLAGSGFSDVLRTEITVNRVITDPEASIPREIMGNPVGELVAEKGPEAMQNIVEYVLDGMKDYLLGPDLVIPEHTYLFQARVG